MSIKEIIKRGLLYIVKGVPNVHISAKIYYTSPSNS